MNGMSVRRGGASGFEQAVIDRRDLELRLLQGNEVGDSAGEGFTRAVVLVIRKKAAEVLTARTAHYARALGAPMGDEAEVDRILDRLLK